jgi:hypothetical protein
MPFEGGLDVLEDGEHHREATPEQTFSSSAYTPFDKEVRMASLAT